MKQNDVSGEIFCDSAEPKSISELRRYGHQVRPVEKGRDSVKFGIQLVQEYKLLVTRRSNNLLEELSKYMYKRNKNGGYDPEPIDMYNHGMDAMRYGVMMKLGKRKEGLGQIPFRIMTS
jgi:phage terminase large subunit